MRRARPLLLGVSLALLVVATWAGRPRPSSGGPWQPRLVLLISIDTCRADHLGCYGYPRATSPNIDRMARQGVVFERAFSQGNESLFSYGSLFTGRYPQRIGPLDYERFRLTSRDVMLPSLLSSYGIRTAGYVAGGHVSRPFGFGAGFETYEDRWDFGSFRSTMPPAMEWMERLAKNRDRGFLFIQGYDAHCPYLPGLFFDELFDPTYRGVADVIARQPAAVDNICDGTWFPSEPSQLWFYTSSNGRRVMNPQVFEHLRRLARESGRGQRLTEGDVRHLVAHYDGCIAYVDVWMGLLLARLEELGLTRETMIVLVGDHGEDLMEHGFFNHRDCVNDSTLRVPLVIWGPGGIPENRRVQDVVQLVDVVPTLLDYGRLSLPANLDGHSLRPLMEGTAAERAGAAGRAYAEGILPMATVRSREGRLVARGVTSASPLPPLDPAHYSYYRIGPGEKEIESPLDAPLARELWNDLQRWWQDVHPR